MPRLPSSLVWLIDRRARVAGEIEKIDSLLAECRRLADEIVPLKELLASIDQTLALHEVPIDVSLISPIISRDSRVRIPHGELTRSILLCLRGGKGSPMNTEAITAFAFARCREFDESIASPTQLKKSVRYRLKNLCRDGFIKRLHRARRGECAVWTLNDLDRTVE